MTEPTPAPPSLWQRWSVWPRPLWLALALVAVVGLPSLGQGYMMDDYVHSLQSEGHSLLGSRWNQFVFASGDPVEMGRYTRSGPFPWWTLPDLKVTFFRPLSSALIALDHLAFKDFAPMHHVHSVLWYALLVLGVALVLRRALPPGVAAGALLLFVIDDAHWMPVAWLANRNALVASAFVMLGLAAHLRWREEGWRPGLGWSVLAYAAGLCGGEAALGALGYLVAYELARGPGSWPRRLGALVPAAAVSAAYVVAYRALGMGAHGSGVYLDPGVSTVAYLRAAPERLLVAAASLFLGAFSDLWMVGGAARLSLLATGLVALAVIAWLLRRLWPLLSDFERKGARWLLGGAALSALPVVATFPAQRLVLVPSIGVLGVVALVLRHLWRRGAGAARLGAWALALGNLFAPVVMWPAAYAMGHVLGGLQLRMAVDTPLADEVLGRKVILFTAPDFSAVFTGVVRMWAGKAEPRAWWLLSADPVAHRLTRTGERTFELEPVSGVMLSSVWSQMFRAPEHRFADGDRVELDGASVTVLALEGGFPRRIRFELAKAPDSGEYAFVEWRDFALQELTLPPVGASVTLELQKGLLSP